MTNCILILCFLAIALEVCEPKILDLLQSETNICDSEEKKCARKCEKACEMYHKPHQIVGNRFIFGGNNMRSIQEYPHVVALGYSIDEANYEFLCGGSLISPSFVLTAAHCIFNPKNYTVKFVRVGTTYLPPGTRDLDHKLDILIKNRHTHPNFTRIPKLHDLAVLELEKSVRLSFNVKPSCLYTRHEEPEVMEVSGWGATEEGRRSEILQIGYINTVPQPQCQKAYEKKYMLTVQPTHVCAGNDTVNACKGDSGGPLQIKENGISYLVGVTAGGTHCGSRAPGIYTRVSSYLGWIEDIVWPFL